MEKRKILASMLTVGSFSILVKLVGAAKVLVIARYFGVADAADAFLIAFVLIMFLAEAIAGATSASLIPTLIELRERADDVRARGLFSTTTLLTTAQFVVVSLVLLLFAGQILPLVASGFDTQKLQVSRSLLVLMLPVLLLSGTSAIWRGVLNAAGRFAVPAATPALAPLATILLIWGQGYSSNEYTLDTGTLAGSAAEAAVVGWHVQKAGFPLFPQRFGIDAFTRRVMAQYGPMLAGTLLLSGSIVVNSAMASMLNAGSVAALTYGAKVLTVILAIGPSAMATVALPHFSRMAAHDDWTALSQTRRTCQRLILITTIPLTAVLAYASEPLVRALYQRGAFTERDTVLVAEIHRLCILQLPFAMLNALLFRLISSLKSNETLMWGAALHLMSTIVLNYACMQWLGISGIALGGSLAAAIYYCYLTLTLSRLLRVNSPCTVGGVAGCVPR